MAVTVSIAYGNVYGDREGTSRGWSSRMAAQGSLVRGAGCDIFVAAEAYDWLDGNVALLGAIKTGDPDWAISVGRLGNMCYYRPSVYSEVAADVVYFRDGDARNYTDFRLKHIATNEIIHVIGTHLTPGDTGADKAARVFEGKLLGAHIAGLPASFIAGDINTYSLSSDDARYWLRTVGGVKGLQERTAPTNGGLSSTSGASNGQWIDDILSRDSQPVSGAAMFPTGGASDHWGWLKCVLSLTDALDGGDTAYVYLSAIRSTGNALHLIDSAGRETVCVASGAQRWVPVDPGAFVASGSITDSGGPALDPAVPNDPATPGDETVQSKLIGWHNARLGQFDYSQSSGRLDPDSSGHTDCSGLQYACYKAVTGMNVGTNSRDQADTAHGGTVVTTDRAAIRAGTGMERGDLIFYAHAGAAWSHVEMYAGGGQVVGISNPSQDGPRTQALTSQVDYFDGRLKVKRYV